MVSAVDAVQISSADRIPRHSVFKTLFHSNIYFYLHQFCVCIDIEANKHSQRCRFINRCRFSYHKYKMQSSVKNAVLTPITL